MAARSKIGVNQRVAGKVAINKTASRPSMGQGTGFGPLFSTKQSPKADSPYRTMCPKKAAVALCRSLATWAACGRPR